MTKETEQSSMPQENTSEFFSYPICADKRLLPTDFSIREITNQRKLNFRTVRSYIWYTQVLHDFYAALPVNYLPGERDNKRAVNPIPYELEPYFYQYITTASSLPYGITTFLKLPQSNTKLGNHKIETTYTQEEADSVTFTFGEKLIANLYNYVCSDKSAPAFFKNALFQNDTFCDHATSYLWEEEFRKRCDLLIELVSQCSIDKRFMELSHIIYFLDAEIGFFSTFAKKHVDNESACRAFPSVFPKELFQKARPPITRNADGKFPSYYLKNVDITCQDQTVLLSEAFSIIEQGLDKNWKSWLKSVRESYQKSLDNLFPKSEFQKQFETLAEYLSRIRKPYSDDFIYNTARSLTFNAYQSFLQPIGVLQGTFAPKASFSVDGKDPCTHFLQIYVERYHASVFEENIKEFDCLISPTLRRPSDYLSAVPLSDQDAQSPADTLVALCEKYFEHIHNWCWDPIYKKEKHTTVSSVLSLLSEYYEDICSSLLFATTGSLCPSVLQKEWMFIQTYLPERISEYLSGKKSDFPFPGTMLHEVLFFMKIHGSFIRDAKQIASIFRSYQTFMQGKFPSDSEKSV